jgi:hypothetical protein
MGDLIGWVEGGKERWVNMGIESKKREGKRGEGKEGERSKVVTIQEAIYIDSHHPQE